MPKKKAEPLEELKSQAQRIWLAGLGAFAEAEKKSDKLFKNLVKKGKKYEAGVEQAGEAVRGGVTAARNQAGKSFKELESAIDRRVASTMKRLGVASQEEVDDLRKQVASLTKSLKKAERAASRKRKKTGSKTKTETTRKTAKRATAKKSTG